MKLKLLAIAIGAVVSSAAVAAPVALKPGPLYFQFNNIEQVGLLNTAGFANLDVNGDGVDELIGGQAEYNWGVLNISSIQSGAVASPNEDISGGPTYFADDGPGGSAGQAFGIFYGVQLYSADLTKATFGWMDLYWKDAGADNITASDLNGTSFLPSARTGFNQAGKFTTGTFLGRLAFASGAIDGDAITTLTSSVNPTNFSGVGLTDGFANVVDINNDGKIDGADGTWASAINTDWFFVDPNGNGTRGEAGETRDLRFSTFFQNLNAWDDGATVQGLRSNDPARSFVVPEPGSLALLGLAAIGLAATRRRKSA